MNWLLVIIALAGTVLNSRQDRRCFWLWCVSNSGLTVLNAMAGDLAQALFFAVCLVLAWVGLKSWSRQ